MKKPAIVLDIDDVILNTEYLYKEMLDLGIKKEDRLQYFYQHCNSPRVELIPSTLFFAEEIIDNVIIILSTARNDKYRRATIRKLKSYFFPFAEIYMRKEGDLRSSAEVKKEHLQEIMKDYHILAFIDNDLENCLMAKKMGILALRKV